MQRPLLAPLAGALVLAGALAFLPSRAQDAPAIQSSHVRGALQLLTGSGGNIVVSAGPDGLLMVDDKFLNLAGDIQDALEDLASDHELDSSAPRFLINTHYHGDHVGGNPAFGEVATIIAHANVRKRLLAGERPMEPAGLPVVTYEGGASVHFNGEEVRLVHVAGGHTDGDTLVHFTGTNVIHLGDLGFIARFPFIDLDGGGSVDGFIAGLDTALGLADDETRFVPGHGDVCGSAEVQALRDFLVEARARVDQAIREGADLDGLRAAGLLDDFGAWDWGFISRDRMLETLWRDATEGE